MFKGLGGLGDMAKMMKAAQEMQDKMAEMQEDMQTSPSRANPARVWSRRAQPPRAS